MTQTWHRCSPSTDFYEKSKNPRQSNGHLYLFPLFAHTLCHLVCVLSAHTLDQHNNTLLLLLSSFKCTRPKTYTDTDCMTKFWEKTCLSRFDRICSDHAIVVTAEYSPVTGRTETWGAAGQQNSSNEGSDSEMDSEDLGVRLDKRLNLNAHVEYASERIIHYSTGHGNYQKWQIQTRRLRNLPRSPRRQRCEARNDQEPTNHVGERERSYERQPFKYWTLKMS